MLGGGGGARLGEDLVGCGFGVESGGDEERGGDEGGAEDRVVAGAHETLRYEVGLVHYALDCWFLDLAVVFMR